MRRGRLAPLRPRTHSAAGVEQTLTSKYMADHRVSALLTDVVNDLVLLQPPDALKFLHDRLGQVLGGGDVQRVSPVRSRRRAVPAPRLLMRGCVTARCAESCRLTPRTRRRPARTRCACTSSVSAPRAQRAGAHCALQRTRTSRTASAPSGPRSRRSRCRRVRRHARRRVATPVRRPRDSRAKRRGTARQRTGD